MLVLILILIQSTIPSIFLEHHIIKPEWKVRFQQEGPRNKGELVLLRICFGERGKSI